MNACNRFLDALRQALAGAAPRGTAPFRAWGIAGFHAALLCVFGVGLCTGRSLLLTAGVALVCGLSFFAWALPRRALTGRETYVLYEHLWFALACSAAALWALGAPLLPYLDIAAAGLSVFLAFGRLGCYSAGCCHGRPARVGVVYEASPGFPAHLAGLRLAPVQALEAAGLVGIGVVALAAAAAARPGTALVWFLAAYAVLRFATEGLRGDRRPHFFGLSQARWMSLAQFGVALGLSAPAPGRALAVYPALAATLAGALLWRRASQPRVGLLEERHLAELRALAAAGIEAGLPVSRVPVLRASTRGACIAVTAAGGGASGSVHISLSLARGPADLWLLCELAARAFPELAAGTAQFTAGRVLHFAHPLPIAGAPASAAAGEPGAQALYGHLLRALERAERGPEPAGAGEPTRASYFGPRADAGRGV